MTRSFLAACLLGLFAFGSPLGAQTLGGSISGSVIDEGGGALPGVTITMTSTALQVPQVVQITNLRGDYQFTELPAGAYRLSFELGGFTTLVHEQIQLTTGFAARVDATLKVGALQETLTVTGESPVVDLTNTRGGAVLSNELIRSVPISTNYSDIRALMPGMVNVGIPQFGSIQLSGAFKSYGVAGQERTAVEGMDMRASDVPNFAAVEEVSATTFGNTAEMMTPGAQFNMIVKSGGNDFHGSVTEEYMSDRLQSKNIDAALQAQGIQAGDALIHFQDFGGELGGRLIRDKLWFYFAGRKQTNNRTKTGFVSATGPDGRYGSADDVPGEAPVDYWNVTTKVSFQATPKHRFIGFIGRNMRDELIGFEATRYTPLESTFRFHFLLKQNKLEWQGTLTPRLFVSVMGGATGSDSYYLHHTEAPSTFDRATMWQTGEMWTQYDRNLTTEYRDQVNATVSYVPESFLGGSHEFKAGSTYWRAGWPRAQGERGPQGTYRVIFDNGAPVQFQTRNNPLNSSSNSDLYGAYISDTWRVTDNLTLNLGLRGDKNIVYVEPTYKPQGPFDLPGEAGQYPRVDVGEWFSWAPRFGAALALGTKTVVKATYGRYTYLINGFFAQPFSPAGLRTTTYLWSDPNRNGQYDPGEVNLDTSGRDFVSVTGAAARAPNDFSMPHTHEISASIEREVWPSVAVRALYVYKRPVDEYENINPARPFDAYSVMLNRQDPGPDGVTGTADDGGMVDVYDYTTAYRGAAFDKTEYYNRPDERDDHYNNLELALSKRSGGRWSGQMSFLATKNHRSLTGYPQSPNDLYFNLDQTWEVSYRMAGTYRAPYGINLAAIFTALNGQPGQRSYLFRNLPQSSTRTLRLEPFGSQRGPTRSNLNLRAGKTILVKTRHRIDLSVDVFNVLNSNNAWSIGYTSGPTYGYANSIAPPRVARFVASYGF